MLIKIDTAEGESAEHGGILLKKIFFVKKVSRCLKKFDWILGNIQRVPGEETFYVGSVLKQLGVCECSMACGFFFEKIPPDINVAQA